MINQDCIRVRQGPHQLFFASGSKGNCFSQVAKDFFLDLQWFLEVIGYDDFCLAHDIQDKRIC